MKTFGKYITFLAWIGCLLFSAPFVFSEEQAAPSKATVVMDETLMAEGADENVSAAWMGYGLAHINWIRENVPQEQIDSGVYQTSFEEELKTRETLVKIWDELKAASLEEKKEIADAYLDALLLVYKTGFLKEYIWTYLNNGKWTTAPADLKLSEFDAWREKNLAGHQIQTRANVQLQATPAST